MGLSFEALNESIKGERKEGFRVCGGKYKDGDWSEIWFTILGVFPK